MNISISEWRLFNLQQRAKITICYLQEAYHVIVQEALMSDDMRSDAALKTLYMIALGIVSMHKQPTQWTLAHCMRNSKLPLTSCVSGMNAVRWAMLSAHHKARIRGTLEKLHAEHMPGVKVETLIKSMAEV